MSKILASNPDARLACPDLYARKSAQILPIALECCHYGTWQLAQGVYLGDIYLRWNRSPSITTQSRNVSHEKIFAGHDGPRCNGWFRCSRRPSRADLQGTAADSRPDVRLDRVLHRR